MTIEKRITLAAKDYMSGTTNPAFAREHGGLDSLRQKLFRLVLHYEWLYGDDETYRDSDNGEDIG